MASKEGRESMNEYDDSEGEAIQVGRKEGGWTSTSIIRMRFAAAHKHTMELVCR